MIMRPLEGSGVGVPPGPSSACIKCLYRREHPWHDNGTINQPGVAPYMGIDWHDQERKDRERLQRDGVRD